MGRYLFRSPFGSEGWIISVNNLEDLIGGQYWLGVWLLIGCFWHIQSRPFAIFVRGFTWTGEAYLGYSNAGISIMGTLAAIYSWYNNTAYPSEFLVQQDLKLQEHKVLHSLSEIRSLVFAYLQQLVLQL